jgi:myo-inositol catabolism protein IolC
MVVNQTMPALPRTVAEVMRRTTRTNLVLELVINERGEVDDAVVKVPVEPVYDLIVARAARGWKYRPATVDGNPVKYRHAVAVAFSER